EGGRNVLEREKRPDEVERACGKPVERRPGVVVVLAPRPEAIARARHLAHRRRDVPAVHVLEARGKSLREPAGAAPEVERAAGADRPPARSGCREEPGAGAPPGAEET